MRNRDEPITMSPEDFEKAVKGILDSAAGSLVEYESKHLEEIEASDGEYVIDVTARFGALGAQFLVIIECKHHRRKVERDKVQVLHRKLQSIGAQKAMLFSTAGFQKGAIEYATSHGIALVQEVHGISCYYTKSYGPPKSPPPWFHIPKYVGWWYHDSSGSLISEDHAKYTRIALGLDREKS